MLRFNPAPMYVLDEIDAALDLSHTRNIGRIIKTYFPHSQFIIVSLKDGMFSNANVLFRTQFVQGISRITRTVVNEAAHKSAILSRETAIGRSATQNKGNQTLGDATVVKPKDPPSAYFVDKKKKKISKMEVDGAKMEVDGAVTDAKRRRSESEYASDDEN
eukprot:GHVL01014198.1.p2 GENE.GHVL01014198.1~~GHVL01014198.1.p2  ORF type:complete len:161 (-),score=27.87 GHVL01014198.1:379-861(-)